MGTTKPHDQLRRWNSADITDETALHIGKLIPAQTPIGLFVANEPSTVGLGDPTGDAGLRGGKARIECHYTPIWRQAPRQQAEQIFGHDVIHMMNDPEQHDRVEGF